MQCRAQLSRNYERVSGADVLAGPDEVRGHNRLHHTHHRIVGYTSTRHRDYLVQNGERNTLYFLFGILLSQVRERLNESLDLAPRGSLRGDSLLASTPYAAGGDDGAAICQPSPFIEEAPARAKSCGCTLLLYGACRRLLVDTSKPSDLGALGGTRTPNLLIRSQMLYPLSYERMS